MRDVSVIRRTFHWYRTRWLGYRLWYRLFGSPGSEWAIHCTVFAYGFGCPYVMRLPGPRAQDFDSAVREHNEIHEAWEARHTLFGGRLKW